MCNVKLALVGVYSFASDATSVCLVTTPKCVRISYLMIRISTQKRSNIQVANEMSDECDNDDDNNDYYGRFRLILFSAEPKPRKVEVMSH